MKIKYPSLEYRDLSQEHNRTFRDPGNYAEKIFICETGSAERLLTPVGRFDNGFTVVIYNKGPYDVIFDAAIPDDAIGPRAAPSKACMFMYSAHDKMWYGPNYHSNIHESGNIDELDGDNLDVDWNPSVYAPDDSVDEARNADCLAAHLKGIDHEIGDHADHHISEGSDEIDGDRLDVDWNPSIYSPSTSPSEVDSEDELTAHLKGIDDKIGNHSSRHITGGDDELDGDNLDIDWNPSIYSPDDGASQADGLDSLTAHLLGIDTKLGDHVSRHERGGDDELNGDHLDIDWNPSIYSPDSSITEADGNDDLAAHLKGIDSLLGNHASRHISGGSDEIDGDKIDIDWNPSNYSAETSPSEVSSADHLTAHLSGIDTALRTYTQISEPSDPSAGNSVVYSSNGSSSDENAGDFILKVNVGGTVKKHWLFAF